MTATENWQRQIVRVKISEDSELIELQGRVYQRTPETFECCDHCGPYCDYRPDGKYAVRGGHHKACEFGCNRTAEGASQ